MTGHGRPRYRRSVGRRGAVDQREHVEQPNQTQAARARSQPSSRCTKSAMNLLSRTVQPMMRGTVARRCLQAVLRHAAKLWLRPLVKRQAEGNRCSLPPVRRRLLPLSRSHRRRHTATSSFRFFKHFTITSLTMSARLLAKGAPRACRHESCLKHGCSTDSLPSGFSHGATETRRSTGLTDVLYSNSAQVISPAKR